MVRNSLLIVSVVCIRFGLYVGTCVARGSRPKGPKVKNFFNQKSRFHEKEFQTPHLRLVRPQFDLKDPVGVLARDWLIPPYVNNIVYYSIKTSENMQLLFHLKFFGLETQIQSLLMQNETKKGLLNQKPYLCAPENSPLEAKTNDQELFRTKLSIVTTQDQTWPCVSKC